MSLLEIQLAALHEIAELWPEAKAVIIGATALGFYFDMSWRHTADVDFTSKRPVRWGTEDALERRLQALEAGLKLGSGS